MIEQTIFDKAWLDVLQEELESEYFEQIRERLSKERSHNVVFPKERDVFNAFSHTSFDNLKVVVLGQDPYHGEGQAHGLAFSVPDGVRCPPSLRNMFKELEGDLNIERPTTGNLLPWAEQGVFLLNASLTVRQGMPGSHRKLGWETFTDRVIKKISDHKNHVVFILWGNYAQAKSALIDADKHLVLLAPHPSPLSAYKGFFGCQHFSKTNEYLLLHNISPVDWSL